ncbi:hypothetical protein PENSPDRAFT_402108 [Peniophora sp. CONT]|nr:hypothetical protein PENSPDRAFT_402108 [Peniophora sp. CONT]
MLIYIHLSLSNSLLLLLTDLVCFVLVLFISITVSYHHSVDEKEVSQSQSLTPRSLGTLSRLLARAVGMQGPGSGACSPESVCMSGSCGMFTQSRYERRGYHAAGGDGAHAYGAGRVEARALSAHMRLRYRAARRAAFRIFCALFVRLSGG